MNLNVRFASSLHLRPHDCLGMVKGVVLRVRERYCVDQTHDTCKTGSVYDQFQTSKRSQGKETDKTPERKIADTLILRCMDICRFQTR